jgi:CDP-glycerol glycerophosphotransferase (TagB/SpsB family)
MRRFFKLLLKNPLAPAALLFWNIRLFLLRAAGVRSVVCNLRHDYFYAVLGSVLSRLEARKDIRLFLSVPTGDSALTALLKKAAPDIPIMDCAFSPFVNFDMFITAEITGPDLPCRGLKTKTLQTYHGTGIYNLFEKISVLRRFHIHFAPGPQYMNFFSAAGITEDRGHKVFEVGYPKTDAILDNSSYPPELVRAGLAPGSSMPVILYAPHWSETSSIHKHLDAIAAVMAELPVWFLIKPHHYIYAKYPEADWPARLAEIEKKSPRAILLREPDTQRYYGAADIMISDTGTTAPLEFSLTGKPYLIFNDGAWFSGERKGIQPETDIALNGVGFSGIAGLKDRLSVILKGGPEAEEIISRQKAAQEEMVKKYFFNPGKASDAAVRVILAELESGR